MGACAGAAAAGPGGGNRHLIPVIRLRGSVGLRPAPPARAPAPLPLHRVRELPVVKSPGRFLTVATSVYEREGQTPSVRSDF